MFTFGSDECDGRAELIYVVHDGLKVDGAETLAVPNDERSPTPPIRVVEVVRLR